MTDQPEPLTEQQLTDIAFAVAATFDEHEPTEVRRARWENAAWAAGRTVDRNALAVYMAVADAEQRAVADRWAASAAKADSEIRRLSARVVELEETLPRCGRSWATSGNEYPPCARPEGHPEAYCRSADGRSYFLAAEETHVVADDSDDPEHVDDCPGCEAFTLTGHRAAPPQPTP